MIKILEFYDSKVIFCSLEYTFFQAEDTGSLIGRSGKSQVFV